MPVLLDTSTRTDEIVRGVTRLIAEGGTAAVTMRAIAGITRISQASLGHHLRSRQHLLQVVAFKFGQAFVRDIGRRIGEEGCLALLPNCDDDTSMTRVWLAWCDLGRSNDGVGHSVSTVQAEESTLLWRSFPDWDQEQKELVLATTYGLRAAVSARIQPTSRDHVRQLLTTVAGGGLDPVAELSRAEKAAAQPPGRTARGSARLGP